MYSHKALFLLFVMGFQFFFKVFQSLMESQGEKKKMKCSIREEIYLLTGNVHTWLRPYIRIIVIHIVLLSLKKYLLSMCEVTLFLP